MKTFTYKLVVATTSLALVAGFFAMPVAAQETEEDQEETKQESTALQQLNENEEKIKAKEAEIKDIESKIEQLRGQRDSVAAEAEVIQSQVEQLTQQLEKAQLELQQTQLNIQAVREEKDEAEESIEGLEQQVIEMRGRLRELFRKLYEKEQESFIRILLSTGSLSEALAQRTAYEEIQAQTVGLINELKEKVDLLQSKQAKLEQQETDLSQLQSLLQSQQQEIDQQKDEQAEFLSAKREKQLEYENLIAEAKQARTEIEQDIFTLQDSAGQTVELTLTEATDMAKYAGDLVGIRPALLLGVLKIESNVGGNLGSGVFPDDMHPANRDAFLRITKKLGLDPNNTPISARPRSFSGWGGAMGPGQFMPNTWEHIEPRVAQLMNKENPNPYELLDAFVGTAIFLADYGATDTAKEWEAVNHYIAGPNWRRFTWYGDKVLAVAKEYEKEGL